MNYETFVHRVAMEFSSYLPKSLEQYHTLIKADKKGDGREVHLTIERDKVEYIRSIGLYPYYLKYRKGMRFELLMREMVVALINPEPNAKIDKQSAPLKSRLSILVVGSVVVCMAILAVCNHKKRKRGQ